MGALLTRHLRRAGESASELRLVTLAVFHGIVLYGLFDRSPLATSIASYLRVWPIGEAIALGMTPYLMMITVRDHETPLWQRILWLPLAMLILGGGFGTLRFLRATWFYFLTCIPVAFARHTREQAQAGCLCSYVNGFLLLGLAAVFENRPQRFPIGTLLGTALAPEARELANAMAYATVYFALAAVIEFGLVRFARKIERET